MRDSVRLRATFVFLFFCVNFIIITINLCMLQIWNSYFFSSMAEHQYHITVSQLPPRAPIIDRTGNQYLAMNKQCVSAFIVPNQLKNSEAVYQFLSEYFPNAAKRYEKKKENAFMYVKRRLNNQELELIQSAGLSDIHLLHESNRYYPNVPSFPLIGFTDIDNQGQAGIELSCNEILTGKPTKCILEKDARSGYFYFNKELEQEGQTASPLQLTIDSNLQFMVDDELANAVKHCKAQGGAAIIMNPTNGDILAMSSYPFANPQDETFDIELTKHRVVSDAYELGSVIKVFAALAALEEKIVKPDELIDCKNTKSCIIDGRPINTWTPHGIIPFTDVIAYSNNIGIAQIAKRVGTKIYNHYRKLGFGEKTGISFPAEQSGFVNHPSNWSKQSIISLSYGYEISATLLQLARAFSVIANDGIKVTPRILLSDQIKKSERLYSPESIAIMKDILRKTTERGTGIRAKIEGYDIMCKTGTANLLIDGEYDHNRNIFTCAAIIEKGEYKRVIVTFVREVAVINAFASTIAVPLMRTIAEHMIIHDRVIS